MKAHYCTRCRIYYEAETHKHCTGMQRKPTNDEAEKLRAILAKVPTLIRPFVISAHSFHRFYIRMEPAPPRPRKPPGHRMTAAEIADRYRRVGYNYRGKIDGALGRR